MLVFLVFLKKRNAISDVDYLSSQCMVLSLILSIGKQPPDSGMSVVFIILTPIGLTKERHNDGLRRRDDLQ